MKITQDVRKYAEEHGMDDAQALAAGMEEKAQEFSAQGGRIYLPIEQV
jgi:phosphomethylpyrimidine synthase